MVLNLSILQKHMVHGPLRSPHTAGDLGPLEGRPRGGGAGQRPIFITQHHFSVGADVDQQRQLLPLVKPGGHQAAHRVAPYEARNIGKNPDGAGDGQQPPRRKFPGLPLLGHIGGRDQRPGVNAQQQMVHGRIADHGPPGDLLRGDACLTGNLHRQGIQSA